MENNLTIDMNRKLQNRRKWGKFFLVLVIVLFLLLCLEFLSKKYVPEILTYSELKKKNAIVNFRGENNLFLFIEESPYLPFTLPRNLSFLHRWNDYNATYETNKLGYRGTYPRQVKKGERKRILFLGDSFTFGFGNMISTTFVQLIQDDLRETKYEVINGGYHAANAPDSYYAFLEKEGIYLEPDLIPIVIYTGNDIDDISLNLWVKTDDRGLPKKILSKRNYANYKGEYINYLKEEFIPWNYKIPFLKNYNIFIGLTNIFNRFFLKEDYEFQKGNFGRPLSVKEATNRFRKVVVGINSFCKKQKIVCPYLVIPAKYSYSKNIKRAEKYKKKHMGIIEILKKNKLLFLDLGFYLRKVDYFKFDGHLNPVGNEIVKRRILEFFLIQNILP